MCWGGYGELPDPILKFRTCGHPSPRHLHRRKKQFGCLSWDVLVTHYMSLSDPQLRNCMVARCCICVLICCILQSPFVLEQPGSSLLEWHPLFQLICRKYRIYRVVWLNLGLMGLITNRLSGQVPKIYHDTSHATQVFVWLGSYGGGST